MRTNRTIRRTGVLTAVAAAPFALAWRFAHIYRKRAGVPRPMAPTLDPGSVGLAFENRTIITPDGLALPAWWIPAPGGGRAPTVVLVHGWESARHRTLPNAQFLSRLGYHVLTLDIRGHGANPAEVEPVSTGEFGIDALAAVHAALAEPMTTTVAILGHSLGAVGAILAAASEPAVKGVVLTATPSDPIRLTRQTFRLARLPIPDLIAYPLAWFTTRVYLEPRGHRTRDISASRAICLYRGPLLAIHGTDDQVVPFVHFERLVRVGRASRAGDADAMPIESLEIPSGQHSWLYEFPAYRAAVAGFLSRALDGPLGADDAEALAVSVDVRRPVEPDHGFSALAPAKGT